MENNTVIGKQAFCKNACLCHIDREKTALKALMTEVQAKSDSASTSSKCTVELAQNSGI